jgi:hypothetical protein
MHLFIGVHEERAVGYLVLERRTRIWHCTWPDYDARRFHDLSDHPPMWSVGFVWVCRAKRSQGWIRIILSAAAEHLGFVDYGWYTPFSKDGEALARTLCPGGIFIAK